MNDQPARTLHIDERPEIPWLSVVFGYGPMLPFSGGAILAWVTTGSLRHQIVMLTILWAASILAFLAGVRRGLSFRTEGGPALAQIATMFALYVLALVSLVALVEGATRIAVVAPLVGFSAVALLDPIAARSGQAPLFFARLRPTQIPIAVASLAVLLLSLWVR